MPEIEEKAEALARRAAERAARLALEAGEKATELAVERAVKDALIDRDLQDHSRHLEQINGSQREMAESLKKLLGEFHEQTAIQRALGKAFAERESSSVSRRTIWISVAMAVAAYASLVILVLTNIR